MKKIAYATFSSNKSSQNTDFSAIHEYIAQHHIDIDINAEIWDDDHVDWSKYDLVIIGNTWDYHHKPNLFVQWIDTLSRDKIRVINPPTLLKWNISKKYLLDLKKKGIKIPKSIVVDRLSSWEMIENDLISTFSSMKIHDLIVKPLISASSYETYKITYPFDKTGIDIIKNQISKRDILIQEFIPGIKIGEYSLIYINNQFRNSILKKPADNEFRSQVEYGGEMNKYPAPAQLLDSASNILDLLPATPVYARVDMIDDGMTGILMECELIEPYLFLSSSAETTSAFVNAILINLTE